MFWVLAGMATLVLTLTLCVWGIKRSRGLCRERNLLMSVISWRSGRTDRVCRSATCAETIAIVDLVDELSALR